MKDTHIMILAVVVIIFLMMRRQGNNNEVWEFTDYRGRPRRISVHREVH